MSKKYTHLSLVQRYQVEAFIKAGMKQKRVAIELGVDASKICRGLRRNNAQRRKTAGYYLVMQSFPFEQ